MASQSLAQPPSPSPPEKIEITDLLRRLWPADKDPQVDATEIAQAIAYIFTDQLSPVQTGALLTCLNFTGRDRHADVIALSAEAMRDAAEQVDLEALHDMLEDKRLSDQSLAEGTYMGGLCDIVGTGGDSHHTFNISTTSSILASSMLHISKHGNRASTSKSGSADLLTHALTPITTIITAQDEAAAALSFDARFSNALQPLTNSVLPPTPESSNLASSEKRKSEVAVPSAVGHSSTSIKNAILTNITPQTIQEIYKKTNYAFLYAPIFHRAMRYVAPIRKELGWRTIFNLLGPLANPLEQIIEARLIGVARRDLGPVFANALRMGGARKAIIACGAEDLDEVSCAGITYCWMLDDGQGGKGKGEVGVKAFTVQPSDFGLPAHPLADVSPGKEPAENARILLEILQNKRDRDDPIVHFVLMNTATLLVASGVCEAEESFMGEGDDGVVVKERGPGGQRWKEGVRRARWAIESGEAWRQWCAFVEATNTVVPKASS